MAYSLDPSTAESMAAPIPLGTRDDSTDLWCMDFLSPDEPALLRQTETHADVTTATLDGSAVTNLGHFSPSPGWRVTSVKLVSGKALIGTYASEPDAKGEVEYEIDARLLGNARGRSLARAASPRLAVAADLSGTLSISPRSEGPILVYGTGLSPRRYPLARVEEGAEYPAFFFSEDGTRAFFVQKHAGDVTARARYVDLRGATPRTFALQSREDADAHTAAFSPDGSALGYLTEQDGRTALHVTDVSGAEPSAPVSVAAERDVLAWAWQPSAE
jgi:hypothetical protein